MLDIEVRANIENLEAEYKLPEDINETVQKVEKKFKEDIRNIKDIAKVIAKVPMKNVSTYFPAGVKHKKMSEEEKRIIGVCLLTSHLISGINSFLIKRVEHKKKEYIYIQ